MIGVLLISQVDEVKPQALDWKYTTWLYRPPANVEDVSVEYAARFLILLNGRTSAVVSPSA